MKATSAAGDFDTLRKAVMDAGLGQPLADAREVTIPAPIDPSVTNLPALQADKAKVAQILKLHVIPEAQLVAKILAIDTQVATLAGEKRALTNTDSSITVTTSSRGKAMVVKRSIKSDDGVAHTIDHLLAP